MRLVFGLFDRHQGNLAQTGLARLAARTSLRGTTATATLR